jgi:uncharacterized membrane protein
MTGSEVGLALAVFLACTVEAVEALTIVLAIGTTRGWRAAWWGVGAGLACLAVIVAILGPAVTAIPLGVLRVVVGGLLLVFGLQWLRKAVLRAGGRKALHDEDAIYRRQAGAAGAAPGADAGSLDRYGFAIAFKGVLLEGLEVAFIVVTFGANQHHVALAAGSAVLAVLVVVAAGFAARAPLARVPENTMKFAVGVLLCAFGSFWSAEGAGAHWPGGDAALPVLVAGFAAVAVAMAAQLRRTGRPDRAGHVAGEAR